MKSLFNKPEANEILTRISKLTPSLERQWGKMTPDQMLAHCRLSFLTAMDEMKAPRTLMGKVIGRFFKQIAIGDKEFQKNSPTHKLFIVTDKKNFEAEKELLHSTVKKFAEGGEIKVTHEPHAFFGNLTPAEWGILMYKHMDHHLRQFGA